LTESSPVVERRESLAYLKLGQREISLLRFLKQALERIRWAEQQSFQTRHFDQEFLESRPDTTWLFFWGESADL